MQEDFLQYLWRYGLFPANNLYTHDKQRVEVLAPGQLNTDSGPDFLMARIRVGDTIWAGHVEIHVKASDWYRHNHQDDPAYEPVVLHVVYESDCQVKRPGGEPLPTVVLPVKPGYLDNYHRILSTLSPVPCESGWMKLDRTVVENWIINMGVERMEVKSSEVLDRLGENRGGWEETWTQFVFRAFGFGINRESFDRLGRSIPVAAIRSSGSNLFRMEALLFGQADLIPVLKPDPYSRALMSEYGFLRSKFNLLAPENPDWKFLRMRPANFPTVRIAQLAAYLAGTPDRMAALRGGTGINYDPKEYPVTSYWRMHYDFGKKWERGSSAPGEVTANLLQINAILPLKACFEHRNGNGSAREAWMEALGRLPAEDNRITRLWGGFGFRVPNAFYSQAFLHLYNNYCRNRHCLTCRIGQYLIRGKAG